jgi:hypothetical protein
LDLGKQLSKFNISDLFIFDWGFGGTTPRSTQFLDI